MVPEGGVLHERKNSGVTKSPESSAGPTRRSGWLSSWECQELRRASAMIVVAGLPNDRATRSRLPNLKTGRGAKVFQARIAMAAVRIPRIEPGPSQNANARTVFRSNPSCSMHWNSAVPASPVAADQRELPSGTKNPTWIRIEAVSMTSRGA